MKHLLIISVLVFSACEQVIDLKPEGEEPRLIIDALLRVDESQSFVMGQVTVKLTNGFFEPVPPAKLEQITLGGTKFFLETEEGSGVYEAAVEAVDPEIELVFYVDHEEEFYVALEHYKPTVPFEVEYVGISEGKHEINIQFQDEKDELNFYLFDFGEGEYFTLDDELFDGEEHSFSYFFERELSSGEEITVSILGSDYRLNKYISQLIDQSKKEFGPFETPVSTVRGNIINATEIDNIDYFDNVDQPDNYPLGYFALVQEIKQTFIVE